MLPARSCELHRLHMQVRPVAAMSAVHHTGLSEHHALTGLSEHHAFFFPRSISPPTCSLLSRVLLAEKLCLNICNCDLVKMAVLLLFIIYYRALSMMVIFLL